MCERYCAVAVWQLFTLKVTLSNDDIVNCSKSTNILKFTQLFVEFLLDLADFHTTLQNVHYLARYLFLFTYLKNPNIDGDTAILKIQD